MFITLLKALRNILLVIIIVVIGGGSLARWYWGTTIRSITMDENNTIDLPDDFPELDVTFYGEPSPGRLYIDTRFSPRTTNLFAQPDPPAWDYVFEYDMMQQSVIFARKTLFTSANLQRHSDDLLSYYEYTLTHGFFGQNLGFSWGGNPGNSGGQHVLLDGEYTVINRFGIPQFTDLHDLRVDNGNYLWIEALHNEPDNPPAVMQCQLADRCTIITTQIVEMTPDGERLFVWDPTADFSINDRDVDVVIRQNASGRQHVVDVQHSNAIELTPDGNFLVSMRNFSLVVKVDRTTGEVIWRFGGEESGMNEFEIINDPLNGFSRQHKPVWLDNGNLLVYDNGTNHEPPITRIVEYALDEEAMTAELVWSYTTPDAFYARFLGSAYRLPNGNTVISYQGRRPHILEVTPEGEINMEMSLPRGYESYRANYYPWGVDCSAGCQPGLPLENPNS